jgi:hypothetical protein
MRRANRRNRPNKKVSSPGVGSQRGASLFGRDRKGSAARQARGGEMGDISDENKRRRRERLGPTNSAGECLVVEELSRRGFEVEFSTPGSRGYDLLVCSRGLSPQRVRVTTVHRAPWYVRASSFAGVSADQVTVYVLLGVERRSEFPRFFLSSRIIVSRRNCASLQIARRLALSTSRRWRNTRTIGAFLGKACPDPQAGAVHGGSITRSRGVAFRTPVKISSSCSYILGGRSC